MNNEPKAIAVMIGISLGLLTLTMGIVAGTLIVTWLEGAL